MIWYVINIEVIIMKKISLYLDTSVIGGYFDKEFEGPTKRLFELINLGVYEAYISDLTIGELSNAPPIHYKTFNNLISELNYIHIYENLETLSLADKYIDNKVLSTKFIDDARHVAIASCQKIDYIISWNFKHHVNVARIRGFNSVNMNEGYTIIDIRTPLEVISNDPK